MRQFFIATPYDSFVGATTVTSVKVERRGDRYAVIISSEEEADFTYASATDSAEAKNIADALLRKIGKVEYCE